MTAVKLDLHLVVGEAGLFGPAPIPADEIAGAAGHRLQPVPTDWLEAGSASTYHDVLLEQAEDRRLIAAAYAIATGSGPKSEPCLILPGLASRAGRRTGIPALAALVAALESQGAAPRLVLHGLALPEQDDPAPGLQALSDLLRAAGLDSDLADPPAVRPGDGSHLADSLRRNLQAAEIAHEIAALAPELNLRVSDFDCLVISCELRLREWGAHGLVATPAMEPEQRRQRASMLLQWLLAGGRDGSSRLLPDTR